MWMEANSKSGTFLYKNPLHVHEKFWENVKLTHQFTFIVALRILKTKSGYTCKIQHKNKKINIIFIPTDIYMYMYTCSNPLLSLHKLHVGHVHIHIHVHL